MRRYGWVGCTPVVGGKIRISFFFSYIGPSDADESQRPHCLIIIGESGKMCEQQKKDESNEMRSLGHG